MWADVKRESVNHAAESKIPCMRGNSMRENRETQATPSPAPTEGWSGLGRIGDLAFEFLGDGLHFEGAVFDAAYRAAGAAVVAVAEGRGDFGGGGRGRWPPPGRRRCNADRGSSRSGRFRLRNRLVGGFLRSPYLCINGSRGASRSALSRASALGDCGTIGSGKYDALGSKSSRPARCGAGAPPLVVGPSANEPEDGETTSAPSRTGLGCTTVGS